MNSWVFAVEVNKFCSFLCKRVLTMSLNYDLAPSWARFSDRAGVLSRVCRDQQNPELRVQPRSHK